MLGIENLICMGGDPPHLGDHPDAKPVFDLPTEELIRAAVALNQGNDLMSNSLQGNTNFNVGAVVNPGADDLAGEISRLEKKVESGATYFQTQAIFDADSFSGFMESIGRLDIKVLAGIMPIKSVKMAQYMNDKIPGVDIPQELIDKIDAAGDDKAKVADISIEIAGSTVRALRDMTRGVHVMAIGWEDKIPAILDRASD